MTVVEDTNILSRGGREGERTVGKGGPCHGTGRHVVEKRKGRPENERLFTRNNLSPGGSADLLAVTVFLHLLTPASG